MNISRVLSFRSVVALDLSPKTPVSLALGITLGVVLLIGGCAKPAAELTCGQGLTSCDGTCVNTTNSGSNCGSCGHACSGGQVCDNGACSSQCSASTRLCGTSCADETTDPTNCGGCGTTCRSDQICNGACVCASGKTLCNGVCATSCSGTGGSTGVAGHGTGGTGSGTGGMTGAGGNAGRPGTGGVTGGVGGSGGTITGPPPGYYTSGTLHGCSWTGVDTIAGSGTTNTPTDFVAQSPQGFPYCVHGSVGANPTSSTVALLGFNINEPATSAANQCASGAAPTTLPTMVPPANGGIAVSYVRLTGSNIRVQIQGPNGGTDPNDRWCATITQVQGPVFVPLSQFNTACYNNSGTFYPAANPSSKPIAAISFLVPGTVIPSPFSYCVGGFAFGTSVAAAPAYNPNPYPTLTGTIGGADPTNGMAIDFQRVKVAAPMVGGKAYIIQNNNWGTPVGTDQTINYSGNTFTVVSTTGNVTQGGVPASFPSIYIGANGQTAGQLAGVLSTTPDGDGLPKLISMIGTLNTTFSYSHATNGAGDYNATYDVWLAAPPAPAIGYADALNGFVMVWLYQPPGRMPIGSLVSGTNPVTIQGHTWNVWVGPRGTGNNATLMNRPVVSYVATTPLTTLSFDMKAFLTDAASHGIPGTWLVTDVFAGFEIWTGSSAAGLKETGFTATVN